MELFASAPGLAVEESYVRLLNHLPGLAYRCRVGRTDPIVSERLEYTLEFVSKGSYDLLGIPAEDMVRNNNNTIERMMHPDDLQKTRRNMYDSIVAHQPYQVMYRVSLPSGRLKWIWDQGEGVFDADGELRYLEGLMMDISEQKFQELELKEENRQLKASVSNLYGLGNIVGKSEAMRRVYGLILKAAETDTNVIIYGQTGSGKDLVAKAIHEYSARKGNYVPVNCGAIPESLMESELFGYEPGAFSGANSGGQKGLLEQAHTGTFFLDEVSEMPVSLQVKLLRVLQERVVRRVGGKVNHSVDIRIIAASNRNLRELVAQGAFREDLFFRLDVIPLFVPPLRERQGDIRLLVAHFLQSFSRERGCTYRVATELMHAFEAYPWPGNVRELKNFVEYGVGFCEHGVLTLDLMDSRFKTASPPPVKTEKGMPSPPPGPARDTAEYDRIMQLLGRYGQHTEGKKRTASELGISLATLYRRMGQLGITARKHAR